MDTEAVSYTLNFAASGVWDFEVKDAKGQTVNDGDEVIVGETYTFKAIEKTASDTHNAPASSVSMELLSVMPS